MKKIYKLKVNGKAYEVELEDITEKEGSIILEGKKEEKISAPAPAASAPVVSSGETVDAPMPGVIVDVKVKVGDVIKDGDLIAILEAMKMETEIFSPKSGKVSEINVTKGTQVNLGDTLITL